MWQKEFCDNQGQLKSPACGKDYLPAVVQAGVGGAGKQLCGKGPGGGRQQVECEPMVCLGSDE